MKVLANDGISPSGLEKLEQNGFEVDTNKREQDDLVEAINNDNFGALLVRSATKVRKEHIDACPNLKAIIRGGVGMDNIDVEYAREKGIFVSNTPAASSQAVAELTMANLYSIARGLFDSNRNMPKTGASDFKKLKKKYGKGVELRGKTIGILGFGRIGQYTAKYALGNGMNVVAFNRTPKEVEIDLELPGIEAKKTIKTVSKEEVLKQADFITLHVPAQSDGNAVIGKAEFDMMKDGAFIVNTARGGVVDEDALMSAIDSGKIKYAGVDVFVNEPTPSDKILAHEGISLSPHIGAATVEAQDRIGIEIADLLIGEFK